ncbi:MAG TPA: hypothetical protein VIK59_13005 [Verrucomicrobiae bacterium]
MDRHHPLNGIKVGITRSAARSIPLGRREADGWQVAKHLAQRPAKQPGNCRAVSEQLPGNISRYNDECPRNGWRNGW